MRLLLKGKRMKCPLKPMKVTKHRNDGSSDTDVYGFGECDPECAWLFSIGGGSCVCGIIYQENKAHMISNEVIQDDRF